MHCIKKFLRVFAGLFSGVLRQVQPRVRELELPELCNEGFGMIGSILVKTSGRKWFVKITKASIVRLVCWTGGVLATFSAGWGSDQNLGGALEIFLVHPPPVHRVVFTLRTQSSAQQHSTPVESATIYEGGWSDDSWYLQRLLHLDTGAAVSRSNVLWALGCERGIFWQTASPGDLAVLDPNAGGNSELAPLVVHNKNMRTVLDNVANLGIKGMRTGSALFSGAQFIADYGGGTMEVTGAYKIENGKQVPFAPKIYGQVLRKEDEIDAIRIHEGVPNGPSYLAKFYYSEAIKLPLHYPTRIARLYETRSGAVETATLDIHILELPASPLQALAVRIQDLPRSGLSIVYRTNTALLEGPGAGALRPLPVAIRDLPGRQPPVSAHQTKARQIVVISILGFAALLVLVLLVTFNRHNQQKENQ